MALNVVSSDRLSTNVKTSNLATDLSDKVGQSKNIIINGDFQIAQRATTSTTSGYASVDRFAVDFSGTDEACTQAQVDVTAATTPYTKGFRKALKITNGNQTGGAGTTDYVRIRHVFEAQNLANSGWDFKSSSSYLTFAFWVKSSVAQNFYGFFRNSDGTMYQYPFETGSLSADTWTKVTKTIPGNSNLTLNNVNTAGLELYFHAFQGTAETASGVSLDTWTTYSGTAKMPDNTSTWYTTNDATLEVTGFQLTVTDYCPDYPHIPFGDELARCQRYYEVLYMSAGTACCYATGDSTYKWAAMWYFKQEKRAQASVALLDDAVFSVSGGSTITLTGIFTSKDHAMFYYDSGLFRLGDNNQHAAVKAESEL